MTFLQETLPWHVTYEGFTGTLPNIRETVLLFVNMSFRFDPSGIAPACLARTTAINNLSGAAIREAGGSISSLRVDETDRIPLSNGFGCELFVGQFIGNGSVTAGRVTLI